MKAFKIRVQSPEHSEKIQKYLFSLGYYWCVPKLGNQKQIILTEKKFLVYYPENLTIYYSDNGNKQLYRSNGELYFDEHRLPEVELVEKFSYEWIETNNKIRIVETVSYEFKEIPKREVVKIGEKSYFLDELEIALKNIFL